MPILEISMLVFLGIVTAIGLGWFIYDSRSDDEK